MRTILLVLVAACGANAPEPAEGPRAIRTKEHLEEARKHDEIARQRSTFPVRTETEPGDPTTPLAPPVPWTRNWDLDNEHERIARAHRGEAAALEASYQEACGTRDMKKVVGSPITRHRIGGWDTENGVVVLLSTHAGSPETLLADLRCHRAYLLASTAVDQDSPLGLPGLQIDARGDQDGITLTLTVRDSKLLPELRRRIAIQVEETKQPERHED
jgi:hypothetical protein